MESGPAGRSGGDGIIRGTADVRRTRGVPASRGGSAIQRRRLESATQLSSPRAGGSVLPEPAKLDPKGVSAMPASITLPHRILSSARLGAAAVAFTCLAATLTGQARRVYWSEGSRDSATTCSSDLD